MSEQSLEREIKNHFATLTTGRAYLLSLPEEYAAYIVHSDGKIGVAIPYRGQEEKFFTHFAEVELELINMQSLGIGGRALYLYVSEDSEARKSTKFAQLCADFVEPGEAGSNRKLASTNPLKWWEEWSELVGNANHSVAVHGIVGELLVYRYLLRAGKRPVWTGGGRRRLDFVDSDEAWEVKSTLSRTRLEVTIHGLHQLASRDRALSLIVCRLEESEQGESLNEILASIEKLGIAHSELEQSMRALGLREGDVNRNCRYQALELRRYLVDEAFPRITADSFAEGKLPAGIVKMEYTVDLANLPYTLLE